MRFRLDVINKAIGSLRRGSWARDCDDRMIVQLALQTMTRLSDLKIIEDPKQHAAELCGDVVIQEPAQGTSYIQACESA